MDFKTSPSNWERSELQRNGRESISLLWEGCSFTAMIIRDRNEYVGTVLYDDMPIKHPIGRRVYRGSLNKVFRRCTDAAKSLHRNHIDRIRHDSFVASNYQKTVAKLRVKSLGF